MDRRMVVALVLAAGLVPGLALADSQFSYGELMADIGAADVAPAQAAIDAVRAQTQVRFVAVSALAGSPDANDSTLAEASAGSARLDAMRAAIAANAALTAKLAAAGYVAADVLAVQRAEAGVLVVYVEG